MRSATNNLKQLGLAFANYESANNCLPSGRLIWTRPAVAHSALRFQVERLLDAYPQAEDFLARPAVDRQAFNSHHCGGQTRTKLFS